MALTIKLRHCSTNNSTGATQNILTIQEEYPNPILQNLALPIVHPQNPSFDVPSHTPHLEINASKSLRNLNLRCFRDGSCSFKI